MDNCNNTYCGSLLDKQINKSFSNWEKQQSKLKKNQTTLKKIKQRWKKNCLKYLQKK